MPELWFEFPLEDALSAEQKETIEKRKELELETANAGI